jgi:hypothetical protein
MRPLVLLAALAYRTGKALVNPERLSWSNIESWIRDQGNPDTLGQGYVGNQISRARNAYVEIRRVVNGEEWRVTAELVVDPRQGAARSKTWLVQKLDAKLTKKFGDDNRFRVAV